MRKIRSVPAVRSQSAFPEEKEGEISGLSRSVSNLGSSLGTAIAGTILVTDLAAGTRSYVIAMGVLAAFSLVGFAAASRLPATPARTGSASSAASTPSAATQP